MAEYVVETEIRKVEKRTYLVTADSAELAEEYFLKTDGLTYEAEIISDDMETVETVREAL